MRKALSLLFVLSLVSTSASAVPILVGSLGDSDYYKTDATLNWYDAQAQAQSIGGNLVTINDAAENGFLASIFTGELFWTGFNDIVVEGTFEWVSGQAVTYTNWTAGEPNDNGGNEDAMHFNWAFAGGWNDIPVHYLYNGIIEVEAVPAPPVVFLFALGLLGLIVRRVN